MASRTWAEQGMGILEIVNSWNKLPPEEKATYAHPRWAENLSVARGYRPQTRYRVKGLIARGRKLLEADRQREAESDQREARQHCDGSTNAVAIDSSQRIVAAGFTGEDFALARRGKKAKAAEDSLLLDTALSGLWLA